MEVNVNQNIDLNVNNSSISTSSGLDKTSNNTQNVLLYQRNAQVEVEEMNLDLEDFSNNSNNSNNYSSTQIGEALKSVENIKPNIKNLLEKAQNPFNPTKKELLEAIYIYMTNQNVDNIDLNYSNLREMQNKIDSLTKEIEDSRKTKLYQDMTEAEATFRFINYMNSSMDSLEESAKKCIIAYKCEDSSGDTVYIYGDLIRVIDNEYKIIEEISYMDMYGESNTFNKIKDIYSKQDPTAVLEWTDEFKELYNEIALSIESEGYHNYYDDNENTKKIIEERDTLKCLKEYIDSELNYYLKNIDPYVNAEDFNDNNIYLDNNQSLASICSGGSYKSGYVETKNITNTEDMINILSCVLNKTGNNFQDNVYIHNENGETIGIYKITCNDDTFIHYYRDWKETLSDEEVQIFNYINNTKGANAAYKYLKDISRTIDQRWLSAERLKDQEWAEDNKILASIGSIFITPFEGIEAAYYSLESWLTDTDLYRTDVYSKGDQWRGTVSKAIEDKTKVGAFVYGTAMSMLDSASLIGLNYLTGGTATAALSAATMGSRAYVSSLNDALDRGVENNKAMGYAFGASVIETICENYSVGHLMNLEDKIGEKTLAFIKNVAPENSLKSKILYVAAGSITQGLSEGEEELCTEILNTFYDQIICDDKSNFNLAIKSYEAQGMSEDEAILNAFKDEATQCSLSFAGGFLSGVGFGGVKAAKVSNVATKSNINIYDLDSQIKEMQNLDDTNVATSSTQKKVVSLLRDALSTSLYTIKDTKTKVSSLFNNTLKTDKIDLKFKDFINNDILPDYFYKNKYVEFWEKHSLQTELSELNIDEDFSEENIINFINYYSQRETDINLDFLNLFNATNSSILSKIENPEFLRKMILNKYNNIIDNIEVLNNNLSLKFIENNANMIDSLLKNPEFIKIIDDESVSSEIKEYLLSKYRTDIFKYLTEFDAKTLYEYEKYTPILLDFKKNESYDKIKSAFLNSENKNQFIDELTYLKNNADSDIYQIKFNLYLDNPSDFDKIKDLNQIYESFNIRQFYNKKDDSFIRNLLISLIREDSKKFFNAIAPSDVMINIDKVSNNAEFANKYNELINIFKEATKLQRGEFSEKLLSDFINCQENLEEFYRELSEITVIDELRKEVFDVNNPEQMSKYKKEVINYKGKDIEVIVVDDYNYAFLTSGLSPKENNSGLATENIASQIVAHPELWMDMSVKGNDKISMSRRTAPRMKDGFGNNGVIVGFSNIRENQFIYYVDTDGNTPMSIQSPNLEEKVDLNIFDLKNNKIQRDYKEIRTFPRHEEFRANRYLYNEHGELTKYQPDYIFENSFEGISESSMEWASHYGIKIVRLDKASIALKAINDYNSYISQLMNGSIEFNIDSLNHIHYLMNTMEYFCTYEEFNVAEQKYKNLVKYFIVDQEYDFTNIEKKWTDASEFIKLCKQLKAEKNNEQ